MHYENTPLGKPCDYSLSYSPDLLFPIARSEKRDEIGIKDALPFYGYDLWNAYEISWLNQKGKPIVATAEIIIPAETSHIVESKSLKLYFNSFNQTHFSDEKEVENTIKKDLSNATHADVVVQLSPLHVKSSAQFTELNGTCLDTLDIAIDSYLPKPELLTIEARSIVSETVHSHLLKSNCLVTNQPDWGSIEISYSGHKINHENLLKYLISLRNHNEFHEQCVERIFMAILKSCQPTELTVYARYTRRGGIDINPYRSTNPAKNVRNGRLLRQ